MGKEGAVEKYKQTEMYKALEELNSKMKEIGADSMQLNVVGGFALIVDGIREGDFTDIDYVGKQAYADSLKPVIDEIGLKHGLGRGWINNDVMLAGTSLEDLEITTGKLHFHHMFDMEKISVDILDAKDLLRMKVIAVDTAYTATELGGEFSRAKDLTDIDLLMRHRNMELIDLELETYKYVINEKTYDMIDEYIKTKDISRFVSTEQQMPRQQKSQKPQGQER